jgi:prevent-host-death family protein
MSSYNVHEAKSNLSRLLQKTAAGEEVVIVRDGVPVAELIPYRKRSGKRRLGFAVGIAEDLPLLTSDECIRQYPTRCVW